MTETTYGQTTAKRKLTTRDMILCALFSALIAVGAFIKIPIPYTSITLQTMFVSLAAMLLGRKLGMISVLIYIAIGLVGIPVFTQGGGVGYVFQPTFGYLIGFVAAAYITGGMTEKLVRNKKANMPRLLLAQIAGLLVMYATGMIYFYFITNYYIGTPFGVGALFLYCFLATLPGDVITSVLAAWLAKKLLPILSRGR